MSWASKYSKPYLVDKGEKVHLKDYDPADTAKLRSRARAVELLQKGVARIGGTARHALRDCRLKRHEAANIKRLKGMEAAQEAMSNTAYRLSVTKSTSTRLTRTKQQPHC